MIHTVLIDGKVEAEEDVENAEHQREYESAPEDVVECAAALFLDVEEGQHVAPEQVCQERRCVVECGVRCDTKRSNWTL